MSFIPILLPVRGWHSPLYWLDDAIYLTILTNTLYSLFMFWRSIVNLHNTRALLSHFASFDTSSHSSQSSFNLTNDYLSGLRHCTNEKTGLFTSTEWKEHRMMGKRHFMTLPWNVVFPSFCVPCSLYSVPVFHWFHVPSSCMFRLLHMTLYHSLSPIPNTLYRCIRLYIKNQHGRVGRVCLFAGEYPETIELI